MRTDRKLSCSKMVTGIILNLLLCHTCRYLRYWLQGLLNISLFCAMSATATAPNHDGLLQKLSFSSQRRCTCLTGVRVPKGKQRWLPITSEIQTSFSNDSTALWYSVAHCNTSFASVWWKFWVVNPPFPLQTLYTIIYNTSEATSR